MSLSFEDQNIIKDIRNLFRLKKELDYTAIKVIKDRIIKNHFEHEEEEIIINYYKPVRVSNFWSSNYIEYESNSDRNKTLSVEEYFLKIRPYFKVIINNLKKSDTWEIQLTTANNYFFHR